MDSINEKCTNSIKSPDEIERLSTPDYTNFIDKAIHILNNGQQFQKLFICQNIIKANEMDFYLPELIPIIINKTKTEDSQLIKELIKALSVLIISQKEPVRNKIKEQYLKLLQELCNDYYNTQYCDQICELLISLKTFGINFDSFLLILNEDSVRYEGLKLIEIHYDSMNQTQQSIALKHVKQCVSRRNEKMCRIIDQVVLKHEKLLMQLIREQDWLKNLISLTNDADKQVRISACKLFLNTWIKMDEQGYESHLKYQETLQELIQNYSDDTKLIVLTVQCLSTTKSENLQQQFMDFIRPQPIQLDLVKDYYQYILQFDSKIRQQYDDFLINQISNLIDTSKEFSFLKHLSDLYTQLSEQTHQQLLATLFGTFELNQIFFIPYLNDLINKGNRIKNRQFSVQLQRTFDILKKSIFQYEQKGLWFEVEETINILQSLAIILNLKAELYTLSFQYLLMGSQHIRKKITIYFVDTITDNYEKVVPQYLQFVNHSHYAFRVLFIDFCIIISKKRSRNFFKQCNLTQVLQLQNDPVFIVRVKFITLIYELRLLFWNEEKEIVIKLQQALSALLADKKNQVQQAAKDVNYKLQQIHFHHPETIIKQDHANNLKEQQEQIQPRSMIRLNTPTKSNSNSARIHTPTIQSQTPTLKKQQVLFPKPIPKNNCVQLPKVPPPKQNTKTQPKTQNSKSQFQKSHVEH